MEIDTFPNNYNTESQFCNRNLSFVKRAPPHRGVGIELHIDLKYLTYITFSLETKYKSQIFSSCSLCPWCNVGHFFFQFLGVFIIITNIEDIYTVAVTIPSGLLMAT